MELTPKGRCLAYYLVDKYICKNDDYIEEYENLIDILTDSGKYDRDKMVLYTLLEILPHLSDEDKDEISKKLEESQADA